MGMYIIENEEEARYRRKAWRVYRFLFGMGDEIKDSKYLFLKDRLYSYFVKRYKMTIDGFDVYSLNLLARLEYMDVSEKQVTWEEVVEFEKNFPKNKHLLSLKAFDLGDGSDYTLK
ncbi:MAG: hypothetical protein IJV68_03465 [Clostridia bacterium]|nr:hypothetical protein [Clostridia bacterium]